MSGSKTTQDFWDAAHAAAPRLRLPSSLVISTRDRLRILSSYVKPGMRVLEIGFAPGKLLAWVAAARGARVTGLDYSEIGVASAKQLFEALGIEGELRCEDVFEASFPPASFDFVYSHGVIEHFDDPREIVRRHVLPLRLGGVALILIPNFAGAYGRMQRYFDPAHLDIHNLDIMTCERLRALAPADLSGPVRAFRYGRIDPWLLTTDRRWPRAVARGISWAVNAIALVQPLDVPILCPHLVLEITRRQE